MLDCDAKVVSSESWKERHREDDWRSRSTTKIQCAQKSIMQNDLNVHSDWNYESNGVSEKSTRHSQQQAEIDEFRTSNESQAYVSRRIR